MSCGPRPARLDPLGAGSGQPGARYTTYHSMSVIHFAGETREAGRKADATSPSGSRNRSRYSRAKPSHPARTAARTGAPTEGHCARAMAIRDPARHGLGTDERCQEGRLGRLGGEFEVCGACAPSIVAEEVGGRGRPTGESNPAASGRPEAGYRSQATSGRCTRWQLQAAHLALGTARHSERRTRAGKWGELKRGSRASFQRTTVPSRRLPVLLWQHSTNAQSRRCWEG
jgi:hypothetical protein